MDEPEVSPVREEAARQAVALAFALAVLPLAVWVERKLSGPDAERQAKMAAAKGMERAAARVAARAWALAERARLAYERERA